jgi:hypothetical protein
MKAKTQKLIDKFLAERRVSDGGYAPATEDDINLLYQVVDSLLLEKWQEDLDGDLPVDIKIVNRHTHERMYYRPVPYLHKCKTQRDFLDHINTVMGNLSSAAERARSIANTTSKYMDEVRRSSMGEGK